MNNRWQQMVMIATSSIIIVLLSYDHLQQQKKLRKENAMLLVPIEIPDGFLWPKEILQYQKKVLNHRQNAYEHSVLIEKSRAYGLELDPKESINDWRERIQEAEKNSLILDVQSSLSKKMIQSSYVPSTLQERPRMWNLALIGLQEVEVEDMYVMKYELTQASSWFLGHSNTPLLEECPFCSVEISYDDSRTLADRLSQSMGLKLCYHNTASNDPCNGWRLPSIEEWKKARGPVSQKWEYMIATGLENKIPIATGMYAPNMYEIHDIVGLFSEWTQKGTSIGSTFEHDIHQEARIGVRFYRAQNTGSP
ncbi:MAG: hypothetical protein CL916_10465 [Deltaproteobacteria bacterium]|nr:hypothetical protein [Deltaproteobacteria bacterium]